MSEAIFERMRKASDTASAYRDQRIKNFIGRPVSRGRVSGDVGLEIEVEGRGLPVRIPYITPETGVVWTSHQDGSLRGESNEYVTGGAIKIAEVEPMVKALWEEFAKNGTKVKMSNRCSTHVHVNCGMLTPRPITSLIALYGIIEEAITNWCGPDRVSNPFCLRMKDSKTSLEMWEEMCGGEQVVFDKHRNKYNALNLEPLWQQGSVEFRPMRGAEGPDHVVGWVQLLWALREAARTRYQNPLVLAQQVSGMGAEGVIAEIIRDNHLEKTWASIADHPDNKGNIGRMLRDGFLIVQPLLFSTRWDVVEDKEEEGYIEPDVFEKAAIEDRIARFNDPNAPQDAQEEGPMEFAHEPPIRRAPRAPALQPINAPQMDRDAAIYQLRLEDIPEEDLEYRANELVFAWEQFGRLANIRWNEEAEVYVEQQ